MEPVILDDLPFEISTDAVRQRLRIKRESGFAEELVNMVQEARGTARVKALYKALFIETRGDDQVIINGILLKSPVLNRNLEGAYRAFPFVVTCGMELEEWERAIKNMMHRFWAHTIKEMILHSAVSFLEGYVAEHHNTGNLSIMTPGSLKDWPIEEQRPLFTILGDTVNTIGVHVTEGLVMVPAHSISGIMFPTEIRFESCQLCPRKKCSGRRAPYDKDMYERRYGRG